MDTQGRAAHAQLQTSGTGSREGGESSVGVRIGFLEEEELTWAVKSGLSLPVLFQE